MTGSRRRTWTIVAVVVVPILLVGGVLLGRSLWWSLQATPEFPALASAADPSRAGTVAYIRAYPNDGCIWVVRASDGVRRRVGCVEGSVGSLAWRADGRLEGTRFVRTAKGGPEYRWIADVATGTIRDVPGSQRSPSKDPVPENPAGPNGERASFRSTGGRLTVTITDGAGKRTSTSVAAPDTYTFGQTSWSPDGSYLAVHDDLDRVLLITAGAQPRILLAAKGAWGPAITSVDVVAQPPAP